MKSQQQTKSTVMDRISQEIETIRDHNHIKDIKQVNDFTYKLIYHPESTQSPYRQKLYALELILPTTYPLDPPSLRFLDQIYHLNIGFNSGEVRMPVLQDDWSPFLTLNSIVESLDHIMEQPDEDYALDQDILTLYQSDREKYTNKVLENVTLSDVVLCYSERRDFSNAQSPIRRMKGERQASPHQRQKDKTKALVNKLRESMQFANESDKIDQQFGQQKRSFPLLIKAESRDNLYSKQPVERSKSNKKESVPMDTAQSIEAGYLKLNSNNRMPTKAKTLNTQNIYHSEDPKNLVLHRINETIGVFISELNQIEEQMGMAKNPSIKTLLREKHEAQLEMLRELMQLSQEAKRRIVKKLKDEVNGIN